MKKYMTSLALVLLGVAPALAGLATVVKSSGITGGVVVHLGCAEGRDTAGLCPNDGYSVQGLDVDAAQIAKARKFVRETAHEGNISFTTFDGVHLPYVDNMVNLIVAEQLDRVPDAELMRVLAPRGVAMIKKSGVWTRLTKPVPADIDQWTHYLHGPDNNAVATTRSSARRAGCNGKVPPSGPVITTACRVSARWCRPRDVYSTSSTKARRLRSFCHPIGR